MNEDTFGARSQEINRLLEKSEESLFGHLAEMQSDYISTLYSEEQLVRKGKGIFGALETRLREEICVKWGYCQKQHNAELQDSVNLVSAIADIVSTALVGVPPFVVAAILCKKGLSAFCKCQRT